MIGTIVMNSMYSCLLLMAARYLFRYRITLKDTAAIYMLGFLQYMLTYYLLNLFDQQSVSYYIVFVFGCIMEYMVIVLVAFIVEYENIYLAIVILMIYVPTANTVMMIPVSSSAKLSEELALYMVTQKQGNVFYDVIILLITLIAGYICSLLFGKIYRRLKNKNQKLYRVLMIVIFWLMLSTGIIRRIYNVNAIASARVVHTRQVTISAILIFMMVFAAVNLVTYAYNRYEISRLRRENEETRHWIRDLQKQYRQVQQSNRGMEKMLLEGLAETEGTDGMEGTDGTEGREGHLVSADRQVLSDREKDADELWNLSLTGNILLDTLFTYYSHMAREKNVVFEIQSELAGEVVKVENYQISAQTRVLDENGNEIDTEEEQRRGLLKKREDDISLMQQIDMVTISDGVLSVYFEEAEEKEGYIFVNLKLGGGKLMLDYELNKELYIDRLSFGTCNQYKKLKPVRRIVHLKNGVVSCVSKEGRQRISVMFVREKGKEQ